MKISIKSKILLVVGLVILVGLVVGTINSLASATETFAFATLRSDGNALPACIPSDSDCRWQLWRVQRQVSNTSFTSWDLYARYRGQTYHAHGYRISGDATRWLWVIDGHAYWLKAIRRYKDDNPAKVVAGPALLERIRDNQSVCDLVAPLMYVDITDDGGGIRQPNAVRHSCNPPTDGGVPGDCTVTQRLWPDGGAVANCASKHWLQRCRFGGSQPAGQVEQDAGFLTDSAGAPGAVSGVQQAVSPYSWVSPDAQVWRTCTVPAGQACP